MYLGICVPVCADDAVTMVGKVRGFLSKVIVYHPNIKANHCILHHGLLIAKTLPSELTEGVEQAVKMVNYIKLNFRLLSHHSPFSAPKWELTEVFSAECKGNLTEYKQVFFKKKKLTYCTFK